MVSVGAEMSLDARTLLFIYTLLQLIQSGMVMALWLANRRIKGLGWWTAGMLAGAATLPLFAMQAEGGGKVVAYCIPLQATIFTAAVFYIGACQFIARAVEWWRLGIGTALAVAGTQWFLWGHFSLAGRGVVLNLFMAGCYFATAWVLWREDRPPVRWVARAFSTIYAVGAVIILSRVPMLFLDPGMPWDSGNAAKTSGFFLTGIVLTSVWVFFVVMLVNRVEAHERNLRGAAELESERALREALMEVEARKAEEKAMRTRESLARDLHDGIGSITANVILLASMGADEDDAEKGKILREIEMVARRGNQEVRGLLDELDGAPVSWRLFLAELRRCVVPFNETVGIATRWEVNGELPLERITDRAAAASLAKILREAAHNIVRHSGAKEAEIGFIFENGRLHIRVGDDGTGFTEGREDGRGLMNMARRCEELGGGFSIEGSERGTEISMEIALPLSQGTHKEKEST